MEAIYQMFPDTGQLRLSYGATSGLVPFIVPADATSMFLRLIAVGPGCESLGGAAPTIQLRAGTGVIATVPAAPGQTSLFDENETLVGSASYTRERGDVFMVRLDISDKGVPLWRARITNNDPQELGFVWVTAQDPEDAEQPRMSMATRFDQSAYFGESVPNFVETVSNIGPGTLRLNAPPGTDLGGGFSLKKVPSHVEPNCCDRIEIGVEVITLQLASTARRTIEWVFDCNDGDKRNKTVTLSCKATLRPSTREGGGGGKGEDPIKEYTDHMWKGFPGGFEPGDTLRSDTPAGVGERALIDQLTALEESVSRLVHFIGPELRPDLHGSALAHEDPDKDGRVERKDEGQ